MLDLQKRFIDKSRAQGVIVIIAILVEVIGVSLAALSVIMTTWVNTTESAVHLKEAYGATIAVLIALFILIIAAAYFIERLFGEGMTIVFAGVVIVIVLFSLGVSFG